MHKDSLNSKRSQTLIVFGTILLVLIIDQIIKFWIKNSFEPYQSQTLVSGFIELHFIENRGMAFGTEFGSGIWAKYALSIFRLAAIIGIGFYIRKIISEKEIKLTFLIAISLVFAGATGNLIDGAFYDYVFELDNRFRTNWIMEYNENNDVFFPDKLRETGFMLGSVVDMFRFTTRWPSWMPFGLGSTEIFPAIWNVADFSISIGVGLLILKYRKYFGKKTPDSDTQEAPPITTD